MEIQADFRELLELLNAHDVAYIVVGAHALAHHGAPRFTGDLDILVNPDATNAQRVLAALVEFGFGDAGLSPDDFTKPDVVVQLGIAPVRVDVLTSLTAVTWDDAISGCCVGSYGGVAVHYLGREQLICNKQALGRAKDLADIEALNPPK